MTATNLQTIGNTFHPIELDPGTSAQLEFPEFVKDILDRLRQLREERFAYYEALRKQNSKWVNVSRWVLALLGSIAFLLTGFAAALRFAPDAFLQSWGLVGFDKGVLLGVLGIYAVMGAMSFYERGTDKATSYFRHLGIILTIRDLWTKLQFELLKELTALESAADRAAGEAAARERIRVLAQAFCSDLDKAATGELTEWRTEFLASLSELEAAAKKGSEDVTKQIQELVKQAEKASADAKAAAKIAEEAAKPGALNLTVSGDFDDQVVISIDDIEAARSRAKTLAIKGISPGLRKITAQANKGAKDLDTSVMVDIKPGLQEVKMALS